MSEQHSAKKKKKAKALKMDPVPPAGEDFTASEPLQNGVSIKQEREPVPTTNASSVTTSSLDALQSKDSRQIMDVVDRLRRSGLSGIVQLPQLVVCGDQSSGKSSVLEAITEIPFPRKENLCTRFATEIILRRAPTASISTKIIPDKMRSTTEKKRLEAFKSSIVDFSELPNLVEEATILMGLGDDGSGAARAFSRDVLSIEIAGPGRPHLTLVDLPGLIHTENKMQSKDDVELIRNLVQDYIEEKRTIIMAVVSAKNDYANQIILKKCRDVDPKGNRTLGIITKPDFLEAGSDNESNWLDLALNRDINLAIGWHMLKNRSAKEVKNSFAERNFSEAAFFATGRYRELPTDMLGIESLRLRLSNLLYKHLKTELPALQKELNEKHHEVCKELLLLGEKRSTTQEQRRFLLGVGNDYQNIVDDAVNGRYEDPFFGSLDPEEAIDHESNMSRLRAVVQFLNLQFANLMRNYGQAMKVTESGKDVPPSELSTAESELHGGYLEFASLQKVVTRDEAAARVNKILKRSRGRELPCSFDPLLISQLFWEQSANWKVMAEYHVERVADVCSRVVRLAITSTVSGDVSDRLLALKVDAALTDRLTKAKKELDTIIRDTKRHPITYDPNYVDAVQKRRNKIYAARIQQLAKDANIESTNVFKPGVDPKALARTLEERPAPDMEKSATEEALDDSLAYCEDEVKYFIAVVTKQVIERYLLTDLAADTISPMVLGEMTDDEIAYVAAEPEETTRERNLLEIRKAALEKGQQAFKSALGLFR